MVLPSVIKPVQEAKSLMLIQGFLDVGVLGVPQDHVQGGERIKQLLRLI